MTPLLVLIVTSAFAQTPPDHGRVLATAMDVAPGKLKDTTKLSDTKNYVFRGRVVSLDRERTVSLCFDTEHMRVAGAWVGKPVVYAADKNMGPPVEGTMIASTSPTPGWSHDGQWADPRKPAEGPLPRQWAHFEGQYLHGDRVVFAYTVGGVDVLESPTCSVDDGIAIIQRTIRVAPSSRPMGILVCEDSGVERGVRMFTDPTLSRSIAQLARGDETIVAGFAGAPPKTAWSVVGSRMTLNLPASETGFTVRVSYARVPSGKSIDPLVASLKRPIDDLSLLVKGGPPRWTQTIETKGTRGTSEKSPYVVDEIGLSSKNPWNASVRFGGLDFFPDGRAALSTWDGDVWIVSGLDDSLDKIAWKRFASGLQQPLGVKIVDGVVYTAGRDQVTKLIDLNGDGEADFYQNFNNDAGLTLQRHEFVLDLQTDADGNFYYGRSGHYIASQKGENCCVMKLSSNGDKLDVFARGFREPNGLSIGPDGTMIVADNEGDGVPQTPIYRLKPGAFYGYTPATKKWTESEKPIVWLPTTVDRSAGSQAWSPSKGWGPLGNQLIHTSYGSCEVFAAFIDKSAEPWQGAVWKLPVAFQSGVMRARFHPVDQQLYVCGLRGWSTNAVRDGQFSRIRFTGSELPVPVGVKIVKNGIEVAFSGPLDRKYAEDDQNWAGDWAVKALNAKAKRDEMPIAGAKLSADGRTVTVELERLMPVMNYTLQYNLKSAAGATVSGSLHGTIHRQP